MKVIVAGSRHLDERLVSPIIESMLNYIEITNKGPFGYIDEIVSGGCTGVDAAGEKLAREYSIDLKRFEPDWNKHGKAAGPIRNKEMANYADVLVLIWDGKSKGSLSMKKEMKSLNKLIYEVVLK